MSRNVQLLTLKLLSEFASVHSFKELTKSPTVILKWDASKLTIECCCKVFNPLRLKFFEFSRLTLSNLVLLEQNKESNRSSNFPVCNSRVGCLHILVVSCGLLLIYTRTKTESSSSLNLVCKYKFLCLKTKVSFIKADPLATDMAFSFWIA